MHLPRQTPSTEGMFDGYNPFRWLPDDAPRCFAALRRPPPAWTLTFEHQVNALPPPMRGPAFVQYYLLISSSTISVRALWIALCVPASSSSISPLRGGAQDLGVIFPTPPMSYLLFSVRRSIFVGTFHQRFLGPTPRKFGLIHNSKSPYILNAEKRSVICSQELNANTPDGGSPSAPLTRRLSLPC